jgi:hypothetical protein
MQISTLKAYCGAEGAELYIVMEYGHLSSLDDARTRK